jgi:hypothetical protein
LTTIPVTYVRNVRLQTDQIIRLHFDPFKSVGILGIQVGGDPRELIQGSTEIHTPISAVMTAAMRQID